MGTEPTKIIIEKLPTAKVLLESMDIIPDVELATWIAILGNEIKFTDYATYIEYTLGKAGVCCIQSFEKEIEEKIDSLENSPGVFFDIKSYEMLRGATEAFLICHYAYPRTTENWDDVPLKDSLSGVTTEADKQNIIDKLNAIAGPGKLEFIINYFKGCKITDRFFETEVLKKRVGLFMPELIWCYWMEEAMLMQSIQAVCMRFQNRRNVQGKDPLGNLAIDPLRPLNNLLWGYIRDEQHRTSLPMRSREYEYEYGLRLRGKAISQQQTVESRNGFLKAFHDLLHDCADFYKEASDRTKDPDQYPVLHAIQELHMILAQGANNQFGDMPFQCRVEMLMVQYLLSREHMRQFLGHRAMTPYKERWMGRVDAMKALQGWDRHLASVMVYESLASNGEAILQSIRWFDWVNKDDPKVAHNWLKLFKEKIMSYIHAYRAGFGVDLAAPPVDSKQYEMRYMQPSDLIEIKRSKQTLRTRR